MIAMISDISAELLLMEAMLSSIILNDFSPSRALSVILPVRSLASLTSAFISPIMDDCVFIDSRSASMFRFCPPALSETLSIPADISSTAAVTSSVEAAWFCVFAAIVPYLDSIFFAAATRASLFERSVSLINTFWRTFFFVSSRATTAFLLKMIMVNIARMKKITYVMSVSMSASLSAG